jgi:cytidylate kinase
MTSPDVIPDEGPQLVVTISRQIASGGAYIGQRVAQRLGFRYVDREILTRATAALGIDDERSLEPLEERAATVWRRCARALTLGPPDGHFVPPPPPAVDEGDVLQAETAVIREIATAGRAVIVGRGAPHVLRDRQNVFRVFVHAPKALRIAEAQRSYSLDEAAARTLVERSDKARAGFVQSLVGRSWTDACLYHLTIDTSIFAPDLAVDLLVNAVKARRE